MKSDDFSKGMYFSLDLDGDQVTKININPKEPGVQNFAMNVYVFEREYLIKLVNEAFVNGGTYLERDVLVPKLGEMKINGYEYTDYVARIGSLKEYFDENMIMDKNEDIRNNRLAQLSILANQASLIGNLDNLIVK